MAWKDLSDGEVRYSYVQTGMVLNPASTSYWIYRGDSLYRGVSTYLSSNIPFKEGAKS